jgi:nucleotide-binding universal stress UspA family protein
MIRLSRILVPTDFSEFSRSAVDYGSALAARFESELHLLYVLQNPLTLVAEPNAALGIVDMATLRRSAEQSLATLPDDEFPHDAGVVRQTRTGTPFVEIVRYAKDNDVDLIVIGTHGRSRLTHILLGSVAERVVRKAPCPVLTVRSKGHQFVMP